MPLQLLLWWTSFLKVREYEDSGVIFLERYYLGRIGRITWYIHRFIESDPDRGLHDHPWGWAFSLVLRGFYYQVLRADFRAVRWFNWISGDAFHRVMLPMHSETSSVGRQREVWTLFAHGPKSKPWGFLRPIRDFDDDGDMSERRGSLLYRPHIDQDGDVESDAWANTAMRGRDIRRAA